MRGNSVHVFRTRDFIIPVIIIIALLISPVPVPRHTGMRLHTRWVLKRKRAMVGFIWRMLRLPGQYNPTMVISPPDRILN